MDWAPMNRYTCDRISDLWPAPSTSQRVTAYSWVDVMKNSRRTRRSAGRAQITRCGGVAVIWLGVMGCLTVAARGDDATFFGDPSTTMTLTPSISVSGETSAIVGNPGTNLKSDTDNVLRQDDGT